MNTKKRKPLKVPVTQGLKDWYAMDMHAAYQAACLNQFTVDAFGRLTAVLAVVRTALVVHDTPILNAVPTLDAALTALQEVRERGDQTGEWAIPETIRPIVLEGIEMAEACIGTLDAGLLMETASRLLNDMLA